MKNKMLKKNITALFILCATVFALAAREARSQNSVAAESSEITSAQMPVGAERLLPASVPAEFNQAFDSLLQQGEGKVTGGEREILAWMGNFKTAANRTKSIAQMQTNFRNAGWQFEPQGKSGDLEVFSLKKDSPRRVVLGFFVPGDDVMVCALMEILPPGEKSTITKTNINQPTRNDSSTNDSSAKVITVEKNFKYVNLMGNEMPPLPDFPALQPKPGKVRGYVKDWTGKPLSGAQIGVRSSYLAGYYSGGQGVTDANGYYEFAPPKGMAHFYNAGYQIEWGDGVAAVSLHPVDGKLDSFVTVDGAVENFVLLPYGLTSRENFQENPYVASTYYGGSIYISYYTVSADDTNPMSGSLVEGSTLEITLVPENGGQSFIIRQPVGFVGNLTINNIPITGHYKITIKCSGKPLKIQETRKFNPQFGMNPAETIGTGSILFIPGEAKASMVGPQNGAWTWVSLAVSLR
jgi:hypothetical protein